MAHAPPVSRDGFSFAADCFSVTTSGGNVHRRRSPAELKDHFASKDDQPAHFYEAQLLHYGLAPSKVKGTAKLRLMEAVMATGAKALAVPAPLAALEKEMKKEWAKACKTAAAAAKAAAATAAPSAAAAGSKKRKAAAESATDVQVVASGGGSVSVSVTVNHGTAPKRAKTEPKGSVKKEAAKKETAKKEPAKKETAKKEPAKKQPVKKEPAKKGIVKEGPAKKEPAKKETVKKEPTKKEPAKKEPKKKEPVKKEPAKKAPAKKEAPKKDPAKKPRAKKEPSTALPRPSVSGRGAIRSNPPVSAYPDDSDGYDHDSDNSSRRGNDYYSDGYDEDIHGYGYFDDDRNHDDDGDDDDDDDEPPPPYPGSPRGDHFGAVSSQASPPPSRPRPPSLGFLNGRYEVSCDDEPTGYWDDGPTPRLVCTIDGDALWVYFSLGFLHGVMRAAERPRRASANRAHELEWVGRSDFYNEGFDGRFTHLAHLTFVGGGVIEGEVRWVNGQSTAFTARRVEGQPTRSEMSAGDMRVEWDRYYNGY